MRYAFFRLKEQQPDNVRRRFEGSKILQEMGEWPPKIEHYEMIFQCCEGEPNFRGYDTLGVLEYLFRKYNGGNLPDFFENVYGLSIGDIVVLDDAAALPGVEEGAWFCDRIGFEFLGMRLSKMFLDET